MDDEGKYLQDLCLLQKVCEFLCSLDTDRITSQVNLFDQCRVEAFKERYDIHCGVELETSASDI